MNHADTNGQLFSPATTSAPTTTAAASAPAPSRRARGRRRSDERRPRRAREVAEVLGPLRRRERHDGQREQQRHDQPPRRACRDPGPAPAMSQRARRGEQGDQHRGPAADRALEAVRTAARRSAGTPRTRARRRRSATAPGWTPACAPRLWSYDHEQHAPTRARRPARRPAATGAGRGGRARSRSTGSGPARNGVNAIRPPGVSAVVAPASSRPRASGSSLRVATARSTASQQPSRPDRDPRLGPQPQAQRHPPGGERERREPRRRRGARRAEARQAAAGQQDPGQRAPSSVAGRRIHSVLAETCDHG